MELDPNKNIEQNKKIDTTKSPDRKFYEHDTSMGIIEWDKKKFKDALYSIPQEEGKLELLGEKVFEIIKGKKVLVLNANVLDYLLSHKDQIPDEWKGKTIFFLGTVFGGLIEKDDRHFVKYLYYGERDGWHEGLLNTQSIYLDGDDESKEFAAILNKQKEE